MANLAMEPPPRTDSESIRDEKVKVLKGTSQKNKRIDDAFIIYSSVPSPKSLGLRCVSAYLK